jgi:ubiquinone/menaquinone biosynthesis C-methylase UbiE
LTSDIPNVEPLDEKNSGEQVEHNRLILDQFTKQAQPFAEKVDPAVNQEIFELIIKTSGVNESDDVLDVACGPGLLTCALARHVRSVAGIDLTSEMIRWAKLLAAAKNLSNVVWKTGDASALPYNDHRFTAVITRYSLHHIIDPRAVLAEMVRVCKPGGKIVVIDEYTPPEPERALLFNAMEKLRDPSHVKAFAISDLVAMMNKAEINVIKTASYDLEIDLEVQLKSSFPNEGDADKLRAAINEDIGKGMIGIGSSRIGDRVFLAYPTVIIVGSTK